MTMQEPDDNAHPSIELMVRIIEEELWAENKDSHNIIKAIPEQSTDHTRYLQEKLYPTLVPALFEMLKLEQKEQQRSEPSGKYGATGNVDPITWLAHYLLRNNATSNTSRIRHHPYAIVNSVFLAKQQENKDEELSVALLSVLSYHSMMMKILAKYKLEKNVFSPPMMCFHMYILFRGIKPNTQFPQTHQNRQHGNALNFELCSLAHNATASWA
eukprot:gene13215-9061_t